MWGVIWKGTIDQGFGSDETLSWDACTRTRLHGGWMQSSYSRTGLEQQRCGIGLCNALYSRHLSPLSSSMVLKYRDQYDRKQMEPDRVRKPLITSILRLKKSTPYEILLAETGLYSIELEPLRTLIMYIQRVTAMDSDRILIKSAKKCRK